MFVHPTCNQCFHWNWRPFPLVLVAVLCALSLLPTPSFAESDSPTTTPRPPDDAQNCVAFVLTDTNSGNEHIANVRSGQIVNVPHDGSFDTPSYAFEHIDHVEKSSPDARHTAITVESAPGSEVYNALYIRDEVARKLRLVNDDTYSIDGGWAANGQLGYIWHGRADWLHKYPVDDSIELGISDPTGSDARNARLAIPPVTGSQQELYYELQFDGWSADSTYLVVNRFWPGASLDRPYFVRVSDLSVLPYALPIPATTSGHQSVVSWSPQGHRIAYLSADGALVIGSPENGVEKTLPLPSSGIVADAAPTWFPDGQDLVVSDGNTILFYSATTGLIGTSTLAAPPNVYRFPKGGFAIRGSWSTDGQHWLFVQKSSSTDSDAGVLTAFDVKTGQYQTLVTGVATDLVSHFDQLHLGQPISVVPSDTGRLAVASRQSDRITVTLINEDGSDARFLIHNTADLRDLSWSSDGRFVAAVASMQNTDDSAQQLIVGRADGTGKTTLPYKAVRLIRWWQDKLLFIVLGDIHSRDGEERTNVEAQVLNAVSGKITQAAVRTQYGGALNENSPFTGDWELIASPDRQYLTLTYYGLYPIEYSEFYVLNGDGVQVGHYPQAFFGEWSPASTMFSLHTETSYDNNVEIIRVMRPDGPLVWQYQPPKDYGYISQLFWIPCSS